MAPLTKKPTRLTAKQQKTVDKVRDVLEAYPLGIALDDLMKEANLTAWATQQALSLVGASMRYDGLWQLPASKTSSAPTKADDDLSDIDAELDNPSAAPVQDDGGNTQDDGINMQDEELNTQANHVSSPDNDGAPHVSYPNSDIDTVADQQEKHILDEAKDAPHEKLIMPKKPRNKPFTPNPIMGCQVQKGKAKIFLDRRATSKTLTLSLADLKELVNAVEKSERVA